MINSIQVVVVSYRPDWHKWPDGNDIDFSDVLAQRFQQTYVVDGADVITTFRFYPVHMAYVAVGDTKIPTVHPYVDNRVPPSKAVLDQIIHDLEGMAKDGCNLCLWENMYQCFPYVAEKLRGIFKHSVMIHANDCLLSTCKASEPVATYFDSAIHRNIIWKPDGSLTKDLYRDLGVKDVHYATLGTTGGFTNGLLKYLGKTPQQDNGFGIAPIRYFEQHDITIFDVLTRVAQFLNHKYHNDIVFVGGACGETRTILNSETYVFTNSSLTTKIHGIGMRDGQLLPRDPATLGESVPALYLDSFAVLNRQYVGLMGTRPFDAWTTGNLLVQWDPVGELDQVGVRAGVHYATYDGTSNGIINTVKYYKNHIDEAIEIIKAGNEIGAHLLKTYSVKKAIETILSNNSHKFGWAA